MNAIVRNILGAGLCALALAAVPTRCGATVLAGASIDLGVSMSVSPQPAAFDGRLLLQILVTNPSTASVDAVLRVPRPAGARIESYIAPHPWICQIDFVGDLECRTPAFSPGSRFIYAYVPTETAVGGTIALRAVLSSGSPDPVPENNVASQAVQVGPASADLELSLSPVSGQIRPGDALTYRMFLWNAAPSTARTVVFEDALPPDTTFVSLAGFSSAWTCSTPTVGATGVVRCTAPRMDYYRGQSVELVTRVAEGAVGNVLRNTATLSSSTPDPDTSNNSSTSLALVQSGNEVTDLAVAISDSPDPVSPGGTITYNLTLDNHGPSSAVSGGLVIQFPLAEDISLTAAPGWNCVFLPPPPGFPPEPAVAACDNPIVTVGSSNFRLLVRTHPSVTGPIVLTATVYTGTTDSNPINNSATATTSTIFGTTGFAVPALSPALLAAFALLLAVVGLRAASRRH